MCCECEKLNSKITGKDREIAALDQENSLLREMLRLERLRRFGSSSEQTNPDQPELFESTGEDAEIEVAATEHVEYDRRKGKNNNLNGRVEIPEHLERREIVLDLPEDEKICPVTGKEMIKVGEDVTEQLAVEPPKFYVNKYIRPKYASPDRRKGAKVGVKTASLPGGPIDRCKADVSTLAYIITGKYTDHLPLYRQEQMFQRHGVKVPANTMCDWVNNCAEAVKPLYNELKKSVFSCDYVNVDDTPIDLLRKGKKLKQARLWLVRSGSGPPGMFFHFTEDWKNERAKTLLKNFKGYLQTDNYSGYVKVGNRRDIVPLGCWAHVRRRFVEASKIGVKEADAFITLINLLYRIEHRIAALPETMPAADKLALRIKRASRLLNRFFDKVNNTHVLPKSALGKAVIYARNQQHVLRNYLSDLRLKLDNNAAEQAIRPVTLGRKNFLFVGSERGGETAAIFMSLIATCKANKINPYEYLKDILARINAHPHRKLAELLPQNWNPTQK